MNSKEAIKKIMSVLKLTNETFYEAKTDQGVVVKMEGDALEVGKMLYVATDEGMIPAPPGKHMMEDGSEVEVGDDGKVSKIKMGDMETTDDAKKDAEQEKATIADQSMAESEEPKIEMEDGDIKLADGSVFRIGGESAEFGTKIKKVGYDGTLSAIADGAYETADGKVMQIVGGEIQGIQSKAAEMARGGKFTEAVSADGDKLDSPTFDVGEDITMTDKDGKVVAAPDGEYEIILKDESGNDTKIRVEVKDGKIQDREDVEEAPSEEDEMSAFVEAFTTAMKKMETKLDELANKTNVLEKSFKKFSSEPAGSPIKKQINPESFATTNAKLEGFRRLKETISKNN
jgi:hypothetical protein